MSRLTSKELASLSEVNLSKVVPFCSEKDLNPKLLDMIRMAQKMSGFQWTLTSAFRSQQWERDHGRKGTSSHCRGLAVDVSTIDSHTRFKVVTAALLSGFPRVGIGKRFVHLDIDETKAHPIIFHYYDPQNT